MRKLALILALMGSPAAATGLEINVAGQADGTIAIDLFEDTAPAHAQRITTLAGQGAYGGVVFHRVIDGFMAQTGDVQFGDRTAEDFDMRRAGTGGSDLGNLAAEFSEALTFDRGMVGMARSADPDSADSQFFIMFAPAPHLDGQYTIVGEVTSGMDVVDAIKRGEGGNGAVIGEPDWMAEVRVTD
jgi:peptidylprolyl isomerase